MLPSIDHNTSLEYIPEEVSTIKLTQTDTIIKEGNEKMNLEILKKYVHSTWEKMPYCRDDKYYFVQNDTAHIETIFSEVKYQLSIDIPKDLKIFYEEIGFGFLWFNLKQKKGLYRVLSPEELLDLYFEPDDDEMPDDFITYRERAWNNLEENNLLAFCLFDEEESLLYIDVSDMSIYYLSPKRKIANSLDEFLQRLDCEVDYFFDNNRRT